MRESDSCHDAQPSSPTRSPTRKEPKATGGDPMEEATKTTLLKELDSLTEAVASKQPASQQNPQNRKHVTSMEKVMRQYFRKLGTAFPFTKMTALYNRHVEE